MKIRFLQDDKFYNLHKKGDVTDYRHNEALRLIVQGYAEEYKGDVDFIINGKEYKNIPHDNGISQICQFIRNTVEEAYA